MQMETVLPEVLNIDLNSNVFYSLSAFCGPLPSACPKSTFLGLALIAAAMANGGTFAGVEVIGKSGWEALHASPTTRPLDGIIDSPATSFTQGGVNVFQRQEPDPETGLLPIPGVEGFVGWIGLGGSIFQVNLSLL